MLSTGRPATSKGRQVRMEPELPRRCGNRRYEATRRTGRCGPEPGRKVVLASQGTGDPPGTQQCAHRHGLPAENDRPSGLEP